VTDSASQVVGRGPPAPGSARAWIVVPVLAGAFVSVSLGLLAREEAIAPGTYPGGYFRLFFSDTLHLKVWLATAALALGVVQLMSAASIFDRLPWPRPSWIAGFHRWSGRMLFVLTVPVAYHCVFKLGFQETSGRVIAHAFLGCAFYGAFVCKVVIVRMHRFQAWVIAMAGGLTFAVLVALWYLSALWLFQTQGVGL
jgi:hypothetical protein